MPCACPASSFQAPTAANGYNNYTPIPYQKSCKIVADKGWGAYYQFVYTTFPKGTDVPTFKREISAEDDAALDEAIRLDRMLSNYDPGSEWSRMNRIAWAAKA